METKAGRRKDPAGTLGPGLALNAGLRYAMLRDVLQHSRRSLLGLRTPEPVSTTDEQHGARGKYVPETVGARIEDWTTQISFSFSYIVFFIICSITF